MDNKKENSKPKRTNRSKSNQNNQNKDFNKHDYQKKDSRNSVKPKVKEEHNDMQWYSFDAELERLVSSLSYNVRLGSPVTVTWDATTSIDHSVKYNPPGIMKVKYAPAYGGSLNIDSGMNQAAEAIYSYVRSQLRTTANYEPSDILMYLISGDSLYSELIQYVRALLVANKRNFSNMYYPRKLVEAMGFDYDYIVDNYANLITRVNFIILDLGTKYIPNLFWFANRHRFLAGNVFRENERANSQLYLPVPDVFLHYRVVNTGTESAPVYVTKMGAVPNPATQGSLTTPSGLANMDECLTQLATRVHSFNDNADFNRMAADMMNAYGPEAGIFMSTLSADMVLEPVYSPEFLLQVHNSIAIGPAKYVGDSTSTTENTDYSLTYKVVETAGTVRGYLESRYNVFVQTNWFGGGMGTKWLFDTGFDWEGDAATQIEGTRMLFGYATGAGTTKTVQYVGSEIVTGYEMITYDSETGATDYVAFNSGISNTMSANRKFVSGLYSFKYAPIVYTIDQTDSQYYAVWGNTELWTTTDWKFRSNLNEYAIYGLYRVDLLRQGKTLAKSSYGETK